MAILMDYSALERRHPKLPAETEEAWRARLTQDGQARFTTRAFVRDVTNYRALVHSAEHATCPVVIVPEPEPTFKASPDYSVKHDLEAIAAGSTELVITRAQAKDPRFVEQKARQASLENRTLRVEGSEPEKFASEYDARTVVISHTDSLNPRKYADARDRAVREGKFLRIKSAGW
jgi:hypothetical protein